MRDFRVNSVIITTGNKSQGILISKDALMRVVAQNLSPELTLVEKVEGGPGGVNDMTNTMMQKFWDSALALEPPDDEYDTHSELSGLMTSDGAEPGKSMYPSLGLGNSFAFKFEDRKGRVHRFNFGTENLEELISAVTQRMGTNNDDNRPQLLYEDDEGDRVILATDGDLTGAVGHARSVGSKVLRLHLDYSGSSNQAAQPSMTTTTQKSALVSLQTGVLVGAAALTSIGILVYLKRTK